MRLSGKEMWLMAVTLRLTGRVKPLLSGGSFCPCSTGSAELDSMYGQDST